MANVQIKRYSGSAWVDINPKTTIGQVRNLSSQLANMQSDIDGKLAKTGKAYDSDMLDGQHGSYYRNSENIYNPDYTMGAVPPLVKSLFDTTRPDRTAFLPADQIIIEQSVDAGITWTDASVHDNDKRKLFNGERPTIRLPLINGVKNTDAMIRITITGMRYNQSAATGETDRYNFWNSAYIQSTERYCSLDEGWAWVGSNSDRLWLRVERATGGNPNSWTTVREAWLNGWDGGNYFKLDRNTFGGGITQTGNYWNWRLTFRTATTALDFDNSKMSTYTPTNPQTIKHIKLTGQNVWTAPNKLMYHDHLYGWDINQNAKFPAEIYANNNQKVYHPGNKPTPADIDAATATHKHASIEVKVGQDAGSSKLSVFQDIDGAGYTTKTGLELFRQSGSSQSMLEISKPYGSTSSIEFITNEADAFKFNKPIKVGDTNVSLAGHKHEANDITDFNSAVLALSPAGARPASSIDTSILGSTTASATKFLAGDRAWKRVAFSVITDKPDTLSGYGITDAAPLSHASSTSNPHSVTAAQINAMSTSHAANAITSTNISNWSSAYGWGNHASAGYIKAHPTITMGTNTTNTSSPGYAGSFTAIDSITKDSNGHVTKINTKTVTMPSAQSIPSIPSVMDTTEGNTGTATTQRTINAKNLKAIILNHSPAGARTPTGHGHSKSDITNFDSEVLALSPDGPRAPTAHQHSATDIVGGRFSLDRLPTISIAKGGTGATTALAARANLGLGNGATATNVIRQVSFQNNILTIEVV